MSVSTDYSAPVMVNGYACKNCTDVDNAKKHIDPDHPRSGPYGVNAKDDPTVQQDASIKFGGMLSGLNGVTTAKTSSDSAAPRAQGAQLDLTA
jgi:hypothetical protein